MTTLALDGPERQQLMKTLKQWRNFSWRIVESLFEKLLRMSAYRLAHSMQFILKLQNAPAHSALLVRNFLAKNNTVIMPQPPYLPDLAPCDFFLFPRLKRPMKGRRFDTIWRMQHRNSFTQAQALNNPCFLLVFIGFSHDCSFWVMFFGQNLVVFFVFWGFERFQILEILNCTILLERMHASLIQGTDLFYWRWQSLRAREVYQRILSLIFNTKYFSTSNISHILYNFPNIYMDGELSFFHIIK